MTLPPPSFPPYPPPSRRLPSGVERQNMRGRHIAVLVVAVVLVSLIVFGGSLALLVIGLRGWAEADRGGPYAAEPTVLSVTDGDTIVVRVGRAKESVRLLGIDTPETKDPRKPVQCFGREASRRTAELLPKGTVLRLEHDLEQRDAYGRLLAYVWRASDGLFVNLDLVTGGWADVLSIAPNTLHAEEFRTARDAARAAPIGLWKICGGPGRPAA